MCDSAGIQTRNLLIRSQMLYSVELQSQTIKMLLKRCDSAGIQTRNLLIRSQMLYSVELQSHAFRKRLQRYHFILILANILATFYFFIAALPLYALFKPATTSFVISLRLSA